jgi:hypothetical protein
VQLDYSVSAKEWRKAAYLCDEFAIVAFDGVEFYLQRLSCLDGTVWAWLVIFRRRVDGDLRL